MDKIVKPLILFFFFNAQFFRKNQTIYCQWVGTGSNYKSRWTQGSWYLKECQIIYAIFSFFIVPALRNSCLNDASRSLECLSYRVGHRPGPPAANKSISNIFHGMEGDYTADRARPFPELQGQVKEHGVLVKSCNKESQLAGREITEGHEEAALHHERGEALEQVAQRSFGISSWVLPKLN